MAETWLTRVERRLKALEDWREDQGHYNEAAEAENAVRDHVIAGHDARLTAIEAKLTAPPDPPIVVDEGPIVIDGEGRVEINLAERDVWPGFRTKDNDYQVAELVFRGPGVIRPQPGFAAIRAVNMGGGATLTVSGSPTAPVELHASGDDIGAIDAPAIALVKLEHVLATADQRKTKDRHARPSCVWCPNTKVVADASVFLGGNSSVYSPLAESIATECLLMPRQFAVNGYAWSGGYLLQSIVLPQGSGRGVLLERIDGLIDQCVIFSCDLGGLSNASPADPEAVYDRYGLDAPGVRVRYGSRAAISNSAILSVGGGRFNNSTGVMISHAPGGGVVGNWIAAINVAPGSRPDFAGRDDYKIAQRHFRARPISFESVGSAEQRADLNVRDNQFWGNQYLFSTTGSDIDAGTNVGGIVDNVWGWADGPTIAKELEARARKHLEVISRAWWNRPEIVGLVESTFAALRGDVIGASPWSFRATWSTGLDGPHEIAEMNRNSQHSESWRPVEWGARDTTFASPSDHAVPRYLIIDGERVNAPGGEA